MAASHREYATPGIYVDARGNVSSPREARTLEAVMLREA